MSTKHRSGSCTSTSMGSAELVPLAAVVRIESAMAQRAIEIFGLAADSGAPTDAEPAHPWDATRERSRAPLYLIVDAD